MLYYYVCYLLTYVYQPINEDRISTAVVINSSNFSIPTHELELSREGAAVHYQENLWYDQGKPYCLMRNRIGVWCNSVAV